MLCTEFCSKWSETLSYKIARLFDSFVSSQSMIEGTTSIANSKSVMYQATPFEFHTHRGFKRYLTQGECEFRVDSSFGTS